MIEAANFKVFDKNKAETADQVDQMFADDVTKKNQIKAVFGGSAANTLKAWIKYSLKKRCILWNRNIL